MIKFLTMVLIYVSSIAAWSACDGNRQTITVPDPITTGNFDINLKVYRPVTTQKFPVVFILPPIVGETPLDGALALNFCLNGIGAYVLDVLNDPPESEQITNLNTHEDAFIRSELALGRLTMDLSVDQEVNGNFGIIGASLGGILSAYLAGANSLLKSSVILAGAGDVAHILAASEQESVKRLREARIQQFNLSGKNAYENFIRPFITRDPLIVAQNIPANSSFIFITRFDDAVPTTDQRQLARAINNPKIIELNNTHIPGIVEASTVFADEILEFFKARLQ